MGEERKKASSQLTNYFSWYWIAIIVMTKRSRIKGLKILACRQAITDEIVKEVFPEEVAFKQRPELHKRLNHAKT